MDKDKEKGKKKKSDNELMVITTSRLRKAKRTLAYRLWGGSLFFTFGIMGLVVGGLYAHADSALTGWWLFGTLGAIGIFLGLYYTCTC